MRIGGGQSLAILLLRAGELTGIPRIATLALVARVQDARSALGIPPAVELGSGRNRSPGGKP